MNQHPRIDRPFGEDPSEYHIVRPERERSAYSDAYYRAVPREDRSPYGYNPARYYAGEHSACHRGQMGLKTVLILCLVCVTVASLLSAGGLYLISRNMHRSEDPAPSFYAEAGEAREPAGPLTLDPAGTAGTALSGEELYAAACGQVVAVLSTGSQGGNIAGSGIIVSSDGYILTNYHVIQAGVLRGWPLTIVTFDGTEYDAQIVGAETDSDLAVLKIEAQDLAAAPLGDSDSLAVGQTIYTVGNPTRDLPCTMTKGIVSARDRDILIDDNVTANMFQFDAAVNSGSSGGPVYDVYGRVVGVTTAKYTADGVEGLGFAIPIADACSIANELITKGYVSGKAYLGLMLDSFSPAVAQYFRAVPGAYVSAVQPGSAADAAGLQKGDIITAVDDTPVTDADELVAAVRGYRAGDTAVLTVHRGDETITLPVVFGEELPAATPQP